MRIHKTLAIAATLAVALIQFPRAATAQTVEEIIAASIEASGGPEALSKVKSIRLTGTVKLELRPGGALDIPPMDGTVEVAMMPGTGLYQKSVIAGTASSSGWDGEVAWEQGMGGLRRMKAEETKLMVQRTYVNVFHGIREHGPEGLVYAKLDDETVDDAPYHVIEVSGEDYPTQRVYIDKASNLISRTVYTTNVPTVGETTVTAGSSAYEMHDGVALPSVGTLFIPGVIRFKATFTETQINTGIDTALFAYPE